ncbi:MAG: NADPH-dependent assimilatory sulfite reductase hemoprotein subunit [Xanthomonadales bacterium]|nr:NADPH-dependent assimilatory sulfite reductase hemoprotein subunit [Xanthomonadales bacterium]
MSSAELSPVEAIKRSSRGLRGTLVESLADARTGALREDDTQLIKFHGSYQQDDRDQREARRLRKLEPAYSFMIRTRLPGGIATPSQWLALTAIAREYGSGSLRLTTRQAFQVHGVIKRELKTTIAAMNAALVDTLAACGDVNRNVMCSSGDASSDAEARVQALSRELSEALLPATRAYHQIWLDEEESKVQVAGDPVPEPLYGETYLPRKFKAGIAIPPYNDIDVYSQDLGFVAIIENDELQGFNLLVGGGMGSTHGRGDTFPRAADEIGFLPPEQLLDVARAVLTVQRDFGNRSDRTRARLKYTIADRSVDWFKAELFSRLAAPLEPPRPVDFIHNGDRFGWSQQRDGQWSLGLRIPSGRVVDDDARSSLSGLAAVAATLDGSDARFVLSPNQNLRIDGVSDAQRGRINTLLARYRLDAHQDDAPLKLNALSCVALPTCALAMAEAERYLPTLLDRVHARLSAHGLGEQAINLRITGCPNGCARPHLAEIALIGKAPGRYNLHLGGDRRGQRLAILHRENIDEVQILDELDTLFASYAAERTTDEDFGDFLWRAGLITGTQATEAAA